MRTDFRTPLYTDFWWQLNLGKRGFGSVRPCCQQKLLRLKKVKESEKAIFGGSDVKLSSGQANRAWERRTSKVGALSSNKDVVSVASNNCEFGALFSGTGSKHLYTSLQHPLGVTSSLLRTRIVARNGNVTKGLIHAAPEGYAHKPTPNVTFLPRAIFHYFSFTKTVSVWMIRMEA